MSKSHVSRLCAALDEQLRTFRERPLEGRYRYLWLDAKVERVREPGGVRQKALVIAYGVHESGRRELLGLDVGEGPAHRGDLGRRLPGARAGRIHADEGAGGATGGRGRASRRDRRGGGARASRRARTRR